jgi:hypothetical protein
MPRKIPLNQLKKLAERKGIQLDRGKKHHEADEWLLLNSYDLCCNLYMKDARQVAKSILNLFPNKS